MVFAMYQLKVELPSLSFSSGFLNSFCYKHTEQFNRKSLDQAPRYSIIIRPLESSDSLCIENESRVRDLSCSDPRLHI